MKPPAFTVFITTYNRAHLIERALNSAANQTIPQKILLIDDGSTDSTSSVVKTWAEAHPTQDLTYLPLPNNSGKPSAWNHALPYLTTPYTVPLDSDDELLPDALDIFSKHMEPIADNNNFVAVEGLAYLNGTDQLSTPPYPQNPLDANWLALTYYYQLWGGDCRRCYKTAVLTQYPFTLYPEEKATMDSLITYRMATKYQTRFFNQPVQIIHQQPGSLSTIGKPRRIASPKSFRLCSLELITIHQKYLSPHNYLKQFIRYIAFSLHARTPFLKQIKHSGAPAIYLLLFPLALVAYLRDVMKYGKAKG